MANIQNNGVAIFEHVFNRDYCHQLIEYFEWCKTNHMTWGRETDESKKNDEAITLGFTMDNSSALMAGFNDIFWNQCYPEYTKYFSVLNDFGKHGILVYKLQKTLPGQGYHVWHCEDMTLDFRSRIGTYILYLNDVEEGGETELLYLNQRIKPTAGTLVLFPSGYVHAHRGNPPLSGAKYIMTGWMEFV